MPIFVLLAAEPVAPGLVERRLFNCDGDRASAIEFCKNNKLASPGVKYVVQGPLPNNDTTPLVLCTQIAQPASVDSQGVAQGQSAPKGQPGQSRSEGQRDSANFQELGDEALSISNDESMYGETHDGTYTDIIIQGGGSIEQPRPKI